MARQNKTRGKTVSRALFDNAKEFFEKYGNDVTRNTYMKNYRKFIDYCRTNFNCKTKEECEEHIQEYADYLKEKGYTPSTVHADFVFIHFCMYGENGLNIRNDCVHGNGYEHKNQIAFAYKLTLFCLYLIEYRFSLMENTAEKRYIKTTSE